MPSAHQWPMSCQDLHGSPSKYFMQWPVVQATRLQHHAYVLCMLASCRQQHGVHKSTQQMVRNVAEPVSKKGFGLQRL